MGYIYKITNKENGHSYIGQTRCSVISRFEEHLRDAKRRDYKFSRALRKYGKDGFDLSVIEQIPDENLNIREKYWIEYYDTFHNGYNSTLGGDGLLLIDRDAIVCLWDSGFSIKSIASSLNICVTSIHNYLQDYENYTVDESKKRGKKNQMKSVNQYDLDGNFVASYDSISDAAKSCGIDRTLISACCRKIRWSGAGYQWRYSDDTKPSSYVNEQKIKRAVEKYDMSGSFIEGYRSITDASKSTNIHHSAISSCCAGKRRSAGGYVWRYAS